MTLIRTYHAKSAGETLTNSADILVFLGHAEYSWGAVEGLDETFYTFDSEELCEPPGDRYKKSHDMRSLPEEVWKPFEEEYNGWGTFDLVKGPLYKHAEAFSIWAGSLMCSLDASGYRPGGDDDYFDYWPSGMEGLKGYAIDLDEIFKTYEFGDFYKEPGFIGVYCNVLLDFLVREYIRRGNHDWLWEHVPDLVNELAELKKVPHDRMILYIKAIGDAKENLSPK